MPAAIEVEGLRKAYDGQGNPEKPKRGKKHAHEEEQPQTHRRNHKPGRGGGLVKGLARRGFVF